MKNKDWDNKLCKKFPLLYRDRFASMQSTCMCWGFDGIGKGWMPLVYDLSSKLEPLIQKYLDEHKSTDCANCGCEERIHELSGKCYANHYLPYHFAWKWKSISWPSKCKTLQDWKRYFQAKLWDLPLSRIKSWISRGINFVLDDVLHQQFGVTKVKPCWCKKFLLSHPCASQVKSKFATLRFYMTSETEEMSALIREAEAKSAVTCEMCSMPGILRDDRYWLETLCDTCETKRKSSDTWSDSETEEKE